MILYVQIIIQAKNMDVFHTIKALKTLYVTY